jgi:hypothetical protein
MRIEELGLVFGASVSEAMEKRQADTAETEACWIRMSPKSTVVPLYVSDDDDVVCGGCGGGGVP